MSEGNGIKMRIIALDEMMKCLNEVGRNEEDPDKKDLLRSLYKAAKERHEFLSLNRVED